MENEMIEIPIWFLPDYINALHGEFVISFEFKNEQDEKEGADDAEK